jgi:hypothetical protein
MEHSVILGIISKSMTEKMVHASKKVATVPLNGLFKATAQHFFALGARSDYSRP